MSADCLGLETSNPVAGRECRDLSDTANAIRVHTAGSEAVLDEEVGTIACNCERQHVSYSTYFLFGKVEKRRESEKASLTFARNNCCISGSSLGRETFRQAARTRAGNSVNRTTGDDGG